MEGWFGDVLVEQQRFGVAVEVAESLADTNNIQGEYWNYLEWNKYLVYTTESIISDSA